ncbi:MAG: hypothetical protein IPM38_00150 [Ignavibacteria bacterium]|nr:hypothetical protein [Ignavibacteria bacterium]
MSYSDSKMNFKGSVHHTVFKGGGKNTPVCTDCHGVHILLFRAAFYTV